MKKPGKLQHAAVLFGTLFLCAVWLLLYVRHAERAVQTFSAAQRPTLVIDAGHGGIDSGAVSLDGTRESDINLAIALRLESIVRFCGQKTVMTRWDDSSKTDILSYSEREDLKQRCAIANSTADAVLVSIHQNDYPTDQPRGAQVLYSAYAGSEVLGNLIQGNLIAQLDPSNRRLAVPAPGKLYMTANTRCPAVLVECGFMSNNFEVLKLKEERYQTALAAVIAASFQQYINDQTV